MPTPHGGGYFPHLTSPAAALPAHLGPGGGGHLARGFLSQFVRLLQQGTTHVWRADTCPHCSGGLKSKATEPADSVSGEGRFLVHRWRLPAMSYHREGLKLYRVPTGTLIPLTGVTLMTSSTPQAHRLMASY